MYNLEEVNQGKSCTVCWLLGEVGTWLKNRMQIDLDDEIKVMYNDGFTLIIKHHERTFALDSLTAHAIKVVCA